VKEGGNINKSLLSLSNVIAKLSANNNNSNTVSNKDLNNKISSNFVNYRDSKLTFLLRDSLGGNSKTLIVANISPSSICYGETLSTLKFAQRAKLIRNKAIINEDSSGTILILKNEIKRLKMEMA
jgi:kinesin family protein 15